MRRNYYRHELVTVSRPLDPMDCVPHQPHCPMAFCAGAAHPSCQCDAATVRTWPTVAQELHKQAKERR